MNEKFLIRFEYYILYRDARKVLTAKAFRQISGANVYDKGNEIYNKLDETANKVEGSATTAAKGQKRITSKLPPEGVKTYNSLSAIPLTMPVGANLYNTKRKGKNI